jgi:two-component sensor histidine kinase
MKRKCQEFRDLKYGGRSMHDYSKLFNHLAQYVPNQVDMNEKKKGRFMISLSTKLQERTALNIGGTFSEFVSNVIIVDYAIRAHKETKKRKIVAAPSESALPKY